MRDWTGNNKSTYATLGASNHSLEERQIDDYYATDPNALKIFLDKIKKDGLVLHKDIWECACGEGHLSEVLKNNGFNVWSTDLIDRGYGRGGIDFLKSISNEWNGDILTNPPYKFAKEFVERALEVTRKGCYIVMFLKIQFLEGQARSKQLAILTKIHIHLSMYMLIVKGNNVLKMETLRNTAMVQEQQFVIVGLYGKKALKVSQE